MGQWATSWHHLALGIPQLWEKGLTGQGVTVAVLDTGVMAVPGLDGADFEYLDARGAPGFASDASGHGTCCASAIASGAAGALGIAPFCKIVSMRVMETGDAMRDVESALAYLAQQRHDVDVVSCSFILSSVTPGILAAVRALTSSGRAVIAAAGDQNVPSPFPEQTQNAITIAAVDEQRSPLGGARIGMWIDAAAPGSSIPVLTPSGDTVLFGESSAAAAVTSGVLALVLSSIADVPSRRKWCAGIEGLIKGTALGLPADPPGTVGCGLINPAGLLASIQ